MSPSRPRRTRVTPARNGPIRSPVPAVGAAFGAAVDGALGTAERLAGISNAAVRGAVECGVQTAYTVIDEYMRRGQAAAGLHGTRPGRRSGMSDDGQRYGDDRQRYGDDRQRYGDGPTAWGPMWPFVAPWMQVMRVWIDAMAAAVPGGVPQSPWDAYTPGAAPGTAPSPATAAAPPSTAGVTPPVVSVQVSSQSPIEVIPRLNPGADALTLVADELKISDGSGAPSLVNVRIACAPGRVHVSVTVPTDQPAGFYSGLIKAAGMPVGDLTVKIALAADVYPTHV